MIPHLNNLLRHMFMAKVTNLRPTPGEPPVQPNNVVEAQVGFQPPNEQWRAAVVGNVSANALNVYLVDLRENRKLRSNARTREVEHGIVSETPAPARMDCHYLVTAWSPATVSPAVEPTLDEQALLYEVTAVLINNGPLIPRKVYAPRPLPQPFPEIIADAELPMSVLPVEGFPKYAEFWGTMGKDSPWKPAVYLIVTLPVALATEVAGPMVTARITEYRHSGKAETAETWIEIGGQVLDAANPLPDGTPAPVADAWVQMETSGGEPLQTTQTDAMGRFSFGGLRAGPYRLRARTTGLGELTPPREIEVPSPSGEYDLIFQ